MRRFAAALACTLFTACGGSGSLAPAPQAPALETVPNGAPAFHWIPRHERLTYGAGADTVQFEYADSLAKPQLNDNCADYAPRKPRVTIKLKKTTQMHGDEYAEYALSAKYGADGLSPYACTIVMSDKSDTHLKATLKIKVTYPAPPSLYVSDYTGGKILRYVLPIVANQSPAATFPVAPSGARPIALSVTSNGTVFYAANENDFLNLYIGECTSSGACKQILSISGNGEPIAASGIAINADGTSGYLSYSDNIVSGVTTSTDGYVEPFGLSGTTWSFGVNALAEVAFPGSSAPLFAGFPITSPYGGVALNGNGDVAVALPFGLPLSGIQEGVALFTAGSGTPTYYHYGGLYETVATAWKYGSNTTFYPLVIGQPGDSFSFADSWFICTVGATSCAAPSSIPVMTNAVGIAVDASSGVYLSTLGTIGGYPNPFPPKYGTQIIYAWVTVGTNEIIENDSSGQPFQTPWGIAIGP
jgi:hypothetical protein